ncbi:putative OsmC-like protein [Streptohalobacillus salinus]|uniref:Putative OsmC-like protein n=1 Tax=Streptohalobacillus salinus TaxID=621096 RepID=A0A2V3VYW0_9BACI|nr:OsmC family protein [Streptohalobacillus salinus]PXW87207.1 putative OsmC-like protein [Streptohalobacillus salinus]
MRTQTFQATAELKEKFLVDTRARQHQVFVDEPEALGGTDTAINPVELLLSALGACQSIVARTYAEKFDINLKHFKVNLAGDIDLDGFFDKADVRPGFYDIRATYEIETDAREEQVAAFVKFLEAHCPVGDTIEHPVHFSSTFQLNNQR